MAGPLALVAGGGGAAGDVALGHAQVQQQGSDLALELHAARVPQHRHQVQLQVLAHAAHLGLGQGRGQVGWGGRQRRGKGSRCVRLIWDRPMRHTEHLDESDRDTLIQTD